MASSLTRIGSRPASSSSWLRGIRSSECVVLAFFTYLGVLGLLDHLRPAPQAVLVTAPFALWALWMLEKTRSSPATRVIREWSSLGLILLGYWCVGWFQSAPQWAPMATWEGIWESWDEIFLDGYHFQSAVEFAGRMVPWVLESVYLLVYAIPPLSLGIVYGLERPKASRYLLVLFLGTFSAYALLPLFPSVSPRIVFPGRHLPQFTNAARSVNTWLLDHLDISTSVFPSGHVAVAFSSAFGLLTVFRHRRRRVWVAAFCAALAVYAATIYGRYHYSVDGLASIAITSLAWLVSSKWIENRWREHED